MNDLDPSKIDTRNQDPSPEQIHDIYEVLLAHIEKAAIEGTEYTDDITEGDQKAKVYTIPVEDQAVSLFRVPQEIRMHNPANFRIMYTTPYKLEDEDTPEASIVFIYDYDGDKTADYALRGPVSEDGSIAWRAGGYMQEESSDFDVESSMRDLTRDDVFMLAAITAAATQLKH